MRVTVFTPTYNRANLLHRVFESLMSQSFEDFEWLIIDDGSIDKTEETIEKFRLKSKFPITYIKRENKGKAQSINEALSISKGEFFLVFDSDDWCTPNALGRFIEAWDALPNPDDYCAVSALKGYSIDQVVGEDYSRMPQYGESYLDRFLKRIRGDKWEFIKTSIHKKFTYDLHVGERYQAPEYAWIGMGSHYKTTFVNEILSIVEYQSDGISRNNLKHRTKSPISTYRFYKRGIELSKGKANPIRCEINAARFALHAGNTKLLSGLSATSISIGLAIFCRDLFAITCSKTRK